MKILKLKDNLKANVLSKDPSGWATKLGLPRPELVVVVGGPWVVFVIQKNGRPTARFLKLIDKGAAEIPSVIIYSSLEQIFSPTDVRALRECLGFIEEQTGLTGLD